MGGLQRADALRQCLVEGLKLGYELASRVPAGRAGSDNESCDARNGAQSRDRKRPTRPRARRLPAARRSVGVDC
jgi:hypothetical protein